MHALYQHTRKRWRTRQEPLWVSIIAKKHSGPQNGRCVRSWLARRLRIAFFGSMKKYGYAPDGTRLKGTEAGRDLFGTAQLLAEQPMVGISQDKVQEQTDRVVQELIGLQERKPDTTRKARRSLNKPVPEWT
jgi:hypothetical protein